MSIAIKIMTQDKKNNFPINIAKKTLLNSKARLPHDL